MARRRKKTEGVLKVIGIAVVIALFGGLVAKQTIGAYEERKELKRQEQELKQELKNEELREKTLEEKKVYVKTKIYVEEMAKKLGLVYPDEIIYRPDSKSD